MRRERAAKQPPAICNGAEILGPLRAPFATQGRSHKKAFIADQKIWFSSQYRLPANSIAAGSVSTQAISRLISVRF